MFQNLMPSVVVAPVVYQVYLSWQCEKTVELELDLDMEIVQTYQEHKRPSGVT